MASFSTHVSVAATVSAMAASALLVGDLVDNRMAVSLWALGVLGGILPDIDSDTSRPVVWLFNLLGAGAASLACWFLLPGTALHLVWLAMGFAWLFMAVGCKEVFFRFTVHRGIYHSLLAVLFVTLVATQIGWRLLHLEALQAWLVGLFTGGGYLVHLLLDEFYSVDFNGLRLKKSFGTAIKPLSLDNWPGSVLLVLGSAVLLWFGPDTQALLQPLQPVWSSSLDRLAMELGRFVR